jgi:hypothetical protein
MAFFISGFSQARNDIPAEIVALSTCAWNASHSAVVNSWSFALKTWKKPCFSRLGAGSSLVSAELDLPCNRELAAGVAPLLPLPEAMGPAVFLAVSVSFWAVASFFANSVTCGQAMAPRPLRM